MEQAAQTFTWTVLALPAILTLVPLAFFAGGYQISRKDTVSVAGRIFYWLGWHGVTLVMAALLTVLHGKYIPDMVVTQLPLLVSVVYLVVGRAVRSPFFAALGLATPGLWVFLTKVWQAFSGAKESLYMLPQEPFWFLLAAAIIFGLLYYPGRPGDFWEDCGPWFATISGCYLMGGLWLLALGQPSLLAAIGVGQYVWAVLLIAISLFLFWCARYMRDPLFMICGVCGFSAGLYAFIVYYPWQ